MERHTAKRWEISKGQTKYTALRFDDIEYHNGDFVYLSHPEQKDPRLSGIARIMDIGGDGSTIKVLRFKRCFGRIPESVSVRPLLSCIDDVQRLVCRLPATSPRLIRERGSR